jgi:diphosphomevalonate decarboxylase
MHALALSAEPGIVYWNGATVEALRRVRELRGAAARVFFTIDAGPQLKAICQPRDAPRVADACATFRASLQVLRSALGRARA